LKFSTWSLPHPHIPTLIAVALALSFLIFRLPLETALGLFAGIILLAASAWEPAIGLSLAVLLGPAKAYLEVARPEWPAEIGQVFFALAVAGWLARGALNRKINLPRIQLLVPLGLYIVVGLFSLLWATSLEEGAKDALKWIEIAVGLVVLVAEIERGRGRWIIAGVLAAGLAQASLGIWQYQFRGYGPETFRILGTHFRAYGTFEQPNPYAGYLGLIWPVAAGLTWERMQAAGGRMKLSFILHPLSFMLVTITALCLIGVYVSFSRGAWIGAATAGMAMAMFLPRRWWVGAGLVGLAIALGFGLYRAGLVPTPIANRFAEASEFIGVSDVRGVNLNDVNFALIERLAHWQAALNMAQAHPWLGVGLGNYGAAYPQYRLFFWEIPLGHAHNIYLNVLAETGAVGLVTYVILWGSVIALTIAVIGRAEGLGRGLALGLLGAWTHLSIHQLFDSLYVNNIHFLIAALLALLIYATRGKTALAH